MIPILTLAEIKEVERRSNKEHGLSELDMIMSAGEAVFQTLKGMLEDGDPEVGDAPDFLTNDGPPDVEPQGASERNPVVAFVCGKGHNGADALSAALLTAQAGYGVIVYQVHADHFSNEVIELQQRIEAAEMRIHFIRSPVDLPVFQSVDLIVDGLLGSGLKGEPEGLIQSCIFGMNRSRIPILSIDVPSGVQCDPSDVPGTTVRAHTTLCLGAMKLSGLFHPASDSFGQIEWSPICFDEKLLSNQPSALQMFTDEDAAEHLPLKSWRSNKYTAGKVLIIAGSLGMHGAPALAANASLRAGAGLVRVALPDIVLNHAAAHLLEVIGIPVGQGDRHFIPKHIEELQAWIAWADSIVIGPGIGIHPETQAFLEAILPILRGKKVVVDGDALAFFKKDDPARRKSQGFENFVITPHAGEFQRMGGKYEPATPAVLLEGTREFARKGALTVVLKGPTTCIGRPDGSQILLQAGNPGMATAGSGDVLSGILGAYLCHLPPEIAAPLSVFMHGYAGDLAREDRSTLGLTASDLILYLPLASKEIEELAWDIVEELDPEG